MSKYYYVLFLIIMNLFYLFYIYCTIYVISQICFDNIRRKTWFERKFIEN